jgi:hypothetical protein
LVERGRTGDRKRLRGFGRQGGIVVIAERTADIYKGVLVIASLQDK